MLGDSPLELEEFWAPGHFWDFRDCAACFLAPELAFEIFNISRHLCCHWQTCWLAKHATPWSFARSRAPMPRRQHMRAVKTLMGQKASTVLGFEACNPKRCDCATSCSQCSDAPMLFEAVRSLPRSVSRKSRGFQSTAWTCSTSVHWSHWGSEEAWQGDPHAMQICERLGRGHIPDPNGARVQMNRDRKLERFPLFLFSFLFVWQSDQLLATSHNVTTNCDPRFWNKKGNGGKERPC